MLELRPFLPLRPPHDEWQPPPDNTPLPDAPPEFPPAAPEQPTQSPNEVPPGPDEVPQPAPPEQNALGSRLREWLAPRVYVESRIAGDGLRGH
jgi:hypothetical protein